MYYFYLSTHGIIIVYKKNSEREEKKDNFIDKLTEKYK